MATTSIPPHSLISTQRSKLDILSPFRRWINQIEINNLVFARFICRLIPCRCPFERNITVLGRTYHIPALCQLNPLYNEVVHLRFRALTYLAEVCGEDVGRYIC